MGIHEMEVERTQASQTIQKLEGHKRDLQEDINSKIRELNHAYNANIPVDIEIEAFSGLLDAEERRLQVSTTNPVPEIISKVHRPITAAGRSKSGRALRPLIGRPISSLPAIDTLSLVEKDLVRQPLPPVDARRLSYGHGPFDHPGFTYPGAYPGGFPGAYPGSLGFPGAYQGRQSRFYGARNVTNNSKPENTETEVKSEEK